MRLEIRQNYFYLSYLHELLWKVEFFLHANCNSFVASKMKCSAHGQIAAGTAGPRASLSKRPHKIESVFVPGLKPRPSIFLMDSL